MLLDLVREGDGVGARVLISLGADLATVRQQVIQRLSGYEGGDPQSISTERPRLLPQVPSASRGLSRSCAPRKGRTSSPRPTTACASSSLSSAARSTTVASGSCPLTRTRALGFGSPSATLPSCRLKTTSPPRSRIPKRLAAGNRTTRTASSGCSVVCTCRVWNRTNMRPSVFTIRPPATAEHGWSCWTRRVPRR